MANKSHSEIRWGGGYDHYDENGRKVGSSVPNFHGGFDEYDASGNKIGESVANSKGGYTHYDKNYRKTGEVNPNFSGGFDHLDASGRKIGSSDLSFSGGYNNSSSDLRCVGTSMPEVYEFQANHQMPKPTQPGAYYSNTSDGGGCYIATCVYGSYDCPQVWTLRRFRDDTLKRSTPGRAFVRIYYALSPTLVRRFGSTKVFRRFWRGRLDWLVKRLNEKGVADTKYEDQ